MKNYWLEQERQPDTLRESINLADDHATRYARYLKGYVNGVYTLPAYREGYYCTLANVTPLGNGLSQVQITWERKTPKRLD